jgi:hypothetical protein
MPRGFLALDIDRACGLENLKLLLVHFDLVRVQCPVLRIAIIGLARLKSDRVVVSNNRDQPVQF